MATTEMECPVCEGNIPLYGDEQDGDEVYCGYCGVMSHYKKPQDDEEACLEPDY
jgi:hypothetical protein